jgi:hypothetical protein
MCWLDRNGEATARVLGIALYLPTLALAEVRAVRPDAAPLLADLLTHPLSPPRRAGCRHG